MDVLWHLCWFHNIFILLILCLHLWFRLCSASADVPEDSRNLEIRWIIIASIDWCSEEKLAIIQPTRSFLGLLLVHVAWYLCLLLRNLLLLSQKVSPLWFSCWSYFLKIYSELMLCLVPIVPLMCSAFFKMLKLEWKSYISNFFKSSSITFFCEEIWLVCLYLVNLFCLFLVPSVA